MASLGLIMSALLVGVAALLSWRRDVRVVHSVVSQNVDDDSLKEIITETIDKKSMAKYNHSCPFCKKDIPKIYTTEIVTKKKKRNKIRTTVIKKVIGEDWESHAKYCIEMKEFLKKTR